MSIRDRLNIDENSAELVVDRPWGSFTAQQVETYILSSLNLERYSPENGFGLSGVTIEPWEDGEKTRVIIDYTEDGINAIGEAKFNLSQREKTLFSKGGF